MGRLFVIKMDGDVYRCKYCLTHLALSSDVDLQEPYDIGNNGGAGYLANHTVNVFRGEEGNQLFRFGVHKAYHLFCVGCAAFVGVKYVWTNAISEMYLTGKCVLKKMYVISPDEDPNKTDSDTE